MANSSFDSNKLFYDKTTKRLYLILPNNIKHCIGNFSYSEEDYEEIKKSISNVCELINSNMNLPETISELNNVIDYFKEIGGHDFEISIGIGKISKFLDWTNVIGNIVKDLKNGEPLIVATLSRSLQFYTSYKISEIFLTLAGVFNMPELLIYGIYIADQNGEIANATIDALLIPEKQEILINAIRDSFGESMSWNSNIITDYGSINLIMSDNLIKNIKGDIDAVGYYWKGNSQKIEEFEIIFKDKNFGNFSRKTNTMMVFSHSNMIQNVKDIIKNFPSIYNSSEVWFTNGSKTYKLFKHNFNPELDRRGFSVAELIAANPDFAGRISDDGTFALLGCENIFTGSWETIDDIEFPLIGNERNNIIYGNEKNNTIEGKGGNDVIYGGSGNEAIDGGTGNDTIYGGA